MPLLETKGAASAQGFGMTLGGAAPVYIEDVFSTWLYTGNGSTQTINNGIDLAGKGGLAWFMNRNISGGGGLFDTVRGMDFRLVSSSTAAQSNVAGIVSATSTGLNLGTSTLLNGSGNTAVAWTFREQPKFFDVVTWTANGSSDQEISHSLGSVPGCIIVKRINTSSAWSVWHRKNGLTDSTTGLSLNGTSAAFEQSWNVDGIGWISSTMFKPASGLIKDASGSNVDVSGTFVAYLFAHNAGGFGLTGADNAISCGAFTTNASGQATVTLGYEPQWLLVKRSSGTQGWLVFDTMRGMYINGSSVLEPNTSGSEFDTTGTSGIVAPNATGFSISGSLLMNPSSTYIYIAIRRGPMRTPTTGTSVLGLNVRTGTATNTTVTGGAGVTDLSITKIRNSNQEWVWASRLTGNGYVSSDDIRAEVTSSAQLQTNPWDVMDGVKVGTGLLTNGNGSPYMNFLLDRAPGVLDVVCYSGTGSARTVAHNLGVVPELMFVKTRSVNSNWAVYASGAGNTNYGILNSSDNFTSGSTFWNNTTPTASVFTVGSNASTNSSGVTYIAFLAATVAGVSRVGTYTGTGSDVSVNCGFTSGARFIMIRAISNSFNNGQWYVWNSARGISPGNDPYLLFNSLNAEDTGTNYVDTASNGFIVKGGSPAGINESGRTYIFWAIA